MSDIDGVNAQTDPELLPLATQDGAAQLAPSFSAIPGQLRSLDGMFGPDLATTVAAALNGVQLTRTPGSNSLTLGITGVGTMAQRNAVAAVADIATADAVDLASAITLANDCKTKINALLAAMRTAAHLTP